MAHRQQSVVAHHTITAMDDYLQYASYLCCAEYGSAAFHPTNQSANCCMFEGIPLTNRIVITFVNVASGIMAAVLHAWRLAGIDWPAFHQTPPVSERQIMKRSFK